ncbi:diacylglycerol kinase [Methylophaga pinxianii]|uniref:diacylglycerol kinase n=1 Tax=Methylophaga pinxianii TaxID=2881052 RepID=UPI001CF419CA|nr:diacylglycerol kinase [Methylophaga pinxianii]MCB2425469.1 diacylglycerol kinase [Methylophaga pinxianii]UPH46391.1 diacylglycerol kinase [Methylophaga pinxianii]
MTAAIQKHTGLKRLLFATYYSLRGLCLCARYESAFRQELAIFLVLLPFVFIIDFTAIERLALIGVMVAVMTVEALNSAIECTLDRFSTELHPLAGRAKDYGSLAVLMTLLIAVATWLVLLWPKFT